MQVIVVGSCGVGLSVAVIDFFLDSRCHQHWRVQAHSSVGATCCAISQQVNVHCMDVNFVKCCCLSKLLRVTVHVPQFLSELHGQSGKRRSRKIKRERRTFPLREPKKSVHFSEFSESQCISVGSAVIG